MSDTIKRVDALNALFRMDGAKIDKALAMGEIRSIPSADRPQGEWIMHFDDIWPEESTIECSVCHEEQPLEIDDNFCPNCGAYMKGINNEIS